MRPEFNVVLALGGVVVGFVLYGFGIAPWGGLVTGGSLALASALIGNYWRWQGVVVLFVLGMLVLAADVSSSWFGMLVGPGVAAAMWNKPEDDVQDG
ncbi:hypothetical protein [Candidatus Palauibacter sp.]|uniref:hypothetical protein n=1 Tax=Candidatus Palauibacter sp. TaxID=3101350 RepID=UPI003B02AEF4